MVNEDPMALEIMTEADQVMKKMIYILIDKVDPATVNDQELLRAVDAAYAEAIEGSSFGSVAYLKHWYRKSRGLTAP